MTARECSLLIFVTIVTLAKICSACFSSGVCGGGVACMPMPQSVCAGGCGPGYGCGQYGCYSRARARSSKTFTGEKSKEADAEFAEAGRTPDEKFHSCCVDRHLPDACLQKCSFATYTKEALQGSRSPSKAIMRDDFLQAMYLRLDSCPVQAAADMHFCAAQGRDHSKCCRNNGVTSTLAGDKCLVFCDQRPGNITQLDMSYLSCYERFENIKGCFWHSLNEIRSSESAKSFDSL
uniref:DB domain-containing protein n=1 Tax=Ascaris lumbricoides TaxID=6252 RepID=A0A0M3HTF9_ASCLU